MKGIANDSTTVRTHLQCCIENNDVGIFEVFVDPLARHEIGLCCGHRFTLLRKIAGDRGDDADKVSTTIEDSYGITIEDDVMLGPRVNLVTEDHPTDPATRKTLLLKPDFSLEIPKATRLISLKIIQFVPRHFRRSSSI